MNVSALRRLKLEEIVVTKKIKDIKRALRSQTAPPESLSRIIQKRERALKRYNDSVREKNTAVILQTQKVLMEIVRQEITATRVQELKSLEREKRRIEYEKDKLLREQQPQQSQPPYWDFSD